MAGDRTEKPTSRRLQDARRKGQLARSGDVVQASQLLAILILFSWFGRRFITGLGEVLQTGLGRMASGPSGNVDSGQLTSIAVDGVRTLVVLAGPFALTAAVAAVAMSTAQGGWNVATEALTLNWGRLNPFTGVKKLVGRAGIDLVKMMVAVTAVAWLAWLAVSATMEDAAGYGLLPPLQSAANGWTHAQRLLRQTVIALAVIAAADYFLQRWRVEKSLRMTKQEVRDDARLAEGNPEVKARIRRMQRDALRRRMLAAVPKATVVITNPTHYAVALEYRRDEMPAPRVLAKGKNALAARIRELAREHEVPIVENVPLAQSLYRGVEVGSFIPAELFGAVAEVLAYLIRLKGLARR
jgi:flagellar biosynthetic protein FlhB